MDDFVLAAESGYLLACKVYFVVRDDSVEELEAAYYILLDELNNLLPDDFREWPAVLHPFRNC